MLKVILTFSGVGIGEALSQAVIEPARQKGAPVVQETLDWLGILPSPGSLKGTITIRPIPGTLRIEVQAESANPQAAVRWPYPYFYLAEFTSCFIIFFIS